MVSGDTAGMAVQTAQKSSPSPADKMLIRAWLHSKSENTRRAYERFALALLAHAGKPLADVTLPDMQNWSDSLGGAASSRRLAMAAVKSLTAFGAETEMLTRNVGQALRLDRERDSLHERILSQVQVATLIDMEKCPRRRALLRLLYVMGLRISEACRLTWRDVTRRQQGGVASVFGKGNKTRPVEIPAKLFKELVALRVDTEPKAPLVPGHNGGPLSHDAAHRIVKRAGKRAGLPSSFSAHWLRHAHVSHSLDRGAHVHAVQRSVGHASLATTTRYAHVQDGDGSGKFLD